MSDPSVARDIRVNGIVQGVGFRPFIHHLAGRHCIQGSVANTSAGVHIHAEGHEDQIERFIRDIRLLAPPLAVITEMAISGSAWIGASGFHIDHSRGDGQAETLISPDVSICADCLQELFDPADRRFLYPFINCTNCGPRYTITRDIPYDRPNTSMAGFRMCPACQREYEDPDSRRFHAQPNACPVCGPKARLYDIQGLAIDVPDPVLRAAQLVGEGHVVAVKGLGGFHLCVDAESDAAVSRLRTRKGRDEKPFAIMARDLTAVWGFAEVSPEEAAILTAIQKPIVLLRKIKTNTLSRHVSPDNRYFGVMLPYTPIHHLLFRHPFQALVMTSANLSEEPIVIDNTEAFLRLSGIADFILLHDRDIYLRTDDSVLRWAWGDIRHIRRSRGYAPMPVLLKETVPPVLAVGGELKNAVCLTKNRYAFVSQHIGDLENLETYDFFNQTITHLERILAIRPIAVAHDMHPDYLSTRYAEARDALHRIPVQHHHAHIASCLAENGMDGPVIGLAFDGTGYGLDGAIWGGEVLIADCRGFERAAYLGYHPMPGAAAAIREPWRMGIAYLFAAFGDAMWDLDLPLFREIDAARLQLTAGMMNRGLNCPMTSSLGRLFDGIAAICGLRSHVTFEGQAAMALEMIADPSVTGAYGINWIRDRELDVASLVRDVVIDVRKGVRPEVISMKFHNGLIVGFTERCARLGRALGIPWVALSGGVFQNRILLGGMLQSLERAGMRTITHRHLPINDGGLSLGQAMIAAARVK